MVLAQANLDQLIARTDNGAVVLSGSARRIEVYTDNGETVVRVPQATKRENAAAVVTVSSENGDVIIDSLR